MRSEPGVRILMISDKSLFGEGLCSLLMQQSDFEVMGHLLHVKDVPAYLDLLRPDILILDFLEEEGDPSLALLRCMDRGWVHKIVTVNRKDNTMCVITGQHRFVEDVGNLVEAIKNDVSGLRPPQPAEA